jgi:hypothetical protein
LSSFAAGGGPAVAVAIAIAVVFCCHPSPQAEGLLLPSQLPLLLFLVVILRRRRRICCCRYQFSRPEKNKLQNRGKFSRLDLLSLRHRIVYAFTTQFTIKTPHSNTHFSQDPPKTPAKAPKNNPTPP